jgi:hypothetical protein
MALGWDDVAMSWRFSMELPQAERSEARPSGAESGGRAPAAGDQRGRPGVAEGAQRAQGGSISPTAGVNPCLEGPISTGWGVGMAMAAARSIEALGAGMAGVRGPGEARFQPPVVRTEAFSREGWTAQTGVSSGDSESATHESLFLDNEAHAPNPLSSPNTVRFPTHESMYKDRATQTGESPAQSGISTDDSDSATHESVFVDNVTHALEPLKGTITVHDTSRGVSIVYGSSSWPYTRAEMNGILEAFCEPVSGWVKIENPDNRAVGRLDRPDPQVWVKPRTRHLGHASDFWEWKGVPRTYDDSPPPADDEWCPTCIEELTHPHGDDWVTFFPMGELREWDAPYNSRPGPYVFSMPTPLDPGSGWVVLPDREKVMDEARVVGVDFARGEDASVIQLWRQPDPALWVYDSSGNWAPLDEPAHLYMNIEPPPAEIKATYVGEDPETDFSEWRMRTRPCLCTEYCKLFFGYECRREEKGLRWKDAVTVPVWEVYKTVEELMSRPGGLAGEEVRRVVMSLLQGRGIDPHPEDVAWVLDQLGVDPCPATDLLVDRHGHPVDVPVGDLSEPPSPLLVDPGWVVLPEENMARLQAGPPRFRYVDPLGVPGFPPDTIVPGDFTPAGPRWTADLEERLGPLLDRSGWVILPETEVVVVIEPLDSSVTTVDMDPLAVVPWVGELMAEVEREFTNLTLMAEPLSRSVSGWVRVELGNG